MTTSEEHYLKSELYELIKNDSSVFDFIQEGSLDGLWYWDINNPEHEWMNPSFWKIMGYDPAEKKHLSAEWQDLIYPEDLEVALENFKRHCEDPNHPYDQVVRYKHKNGSTIWVRCRGLAIRDSSGNPVRMLGAHNDITTLKKTEEKLKARNEELEQLANYDNLTSLLNRHSFQEYFESQLRLAKRRNSVFSLLLIDVDHFKNINDRFGHLQGDEVLKFIADIIRDTSRKSDVIARYGGEEFMVLLSDVGKEGSVEAGERFRTAIESLTKRQFAATISIGASTYLNPKIDGVSINQECNDLINQADKALYLAKNSGRNQVRHFNVVTSD